MPVLLQRRRARLLVSRGSTGVIDPRSRRVELYVQGYGALEVGGTIHEIFLLRRYNYHAVTGGASR